jgi:hypothetical protein
MDEIIARRHAIVPMTEAREGEAYERGYNASSARVITARGNLRRPIATASTEKT